MIKYDSKTHDLLMVAKIMKQPFSPEEAIYVIPQLDKPSRVKESAATLIKYGLLEQCDDGKYMITKEGREELFAIIERNSQGHRTTSRKGTF